MKLSATGQRKSLRPKWLRMVTTIVAISLAAIGLAGAQVPQTNPNDPFTQEVLRALQQRAGQPADTSQLTPNTEIRTSPVYPPEPMLPQVPGNAATPSLSGLTQFDQRPLSGLERVVSERVGQTVRQFGYDVFGRGGSVVIRQSGAIQDNYVLGQGDEIVVTLRGQQSAVYRTRVDRDGRVVLQGLPPVAAAGRRFGDFRGDLEGAVARAYAGTDVFVSIGEVRQLAVRVVGEVNSPGLYSLTALSTALDALSLAGGIRTTGSLRNVQVVRGNQSTRLDLYSLLTSQNLNTDVSFVEGDRIVVPLEGPAVTIVGQVKRPAIYELDSGQVRISVPDLIALAGGLEIRGAYRYSLLRTRADGRREFVDVSATPDVFVQDGEVLFVNPAIDVSLAQVRLLGNVRLSGLYALSDTPTLRALLKSVESLSPGLGAPTPYMLMAAVVRMDAATLQRSVIPFSPVDVITGRNDVQLQSNDAVYILNYREMRYVAQVAATIQETAARRVVEESTTATSGSAATAVTPAGPMTSITSGAQSTAGSGTPVIPVIVPNSPAAQAARQGQPQLLGQLGPQLQPQQMQPPQQAQSQTGFGPANSAATPAPFDLFVPLSDEEKQSVVTQLGNFYVSVLGAVNNPGPYLVAPGTTLDRVVQAAGGVTPRVDLNAFEVTSADIDNGAGSARTIRQVYRLGLNQFSQVALRPYDRVRFNEVFSDRDDGEVSVFGEIRYPGNYEILRGERLSSVLTRAGGLTDAAYPYGAIFLRRSVAAQERQVLQHEADEIESQLVSLVGTLTTREQVSEPEIQYVLRLTDRLRQSEGPGGRIALQIDPAKLAANPELDVVLEPGDRLFIPRRPTSVIVAGEVMAPSGIQYRTGLAVKDYIALAGGTTQIADDSHIFVIQPDGSAVRIGGTSFWRYDQTQLAPGSVIVVPRSLRPFNWNTFLQNFVQITSQLAITAASISVISR